MFGILVVSIQYLLVYQYSKHIDLIHQNQIKEREREGRDSLFYQLYIIHYICDRLCLISKFMLVSLLLFHVLFPVCCLVRTKIRTPDWVVFIHSFIHIYVQSRVWLQFYSPMFQFFFFHLKFRIRSIMSKRKANYFFLFHNINRYFFC